MKFSGKMCLKMILKVTKNHGFSLSLEYTLFEKPQGVKLPPSPAVLGLKTSGYDNIFLPFSHHKNKDGIKLNRENAK